MSPFGARDCNRSSKFPICRCCRSVCASGLRTAAMQLIVQDNTKQRTIHLQSTVVLNEAELSEFVHEEIHP
jgi:NRPS condensation-like uncharacterized protein